MDRRNFITGSVAGLAAYSASALGGSISARELSGLTVGTKDAVALVLGGGGCRGYGHIGFIKALEERALKPDLVVGSSVGSLIGALYASGMSARDLEGLGKRVSPSTLRDWIVPGLGLFGGERIARFVREHVAVRSVEGLPLRFAAVATDLLTGRRVVLDRGDLGLAVQASSSLPGLIEPARIGPLYCVDGNLSSPVPVTTARDLGARKVVAVDVTFPPEHADLRDPYDALYQAFSILTRRLATDERASADLAVVPSLPRHTDMSPATVDGLIVAGYRAAFEVMPALEHLFSGRQPRRGARLMELAIRES